MATKLIKGLSQIYGKYDAFFVDLWGVVHNGINLYPEAVEVLEKLHKFNKRFVLISNAPRPSKSVGKYLLNLKMKKKFIKNIFTSGEAALQSLKKNTYGKKFYHMGPQRDNDLIKGFEKNKTSLEKCDFILCTGLFEKKESTLDYYKNLLKKYTKKKMICTNPDLIVDRGNTREFCAGSVAMVFEKMGGKVVYFGKPYPEVYNQSIDNKNKKILSIGDNLNTDIKGANLLNYDSLIISNGIHKDEIKEKGITKVAKSYEAICNYIQSELKW